MGRLTCKLYDKQAPITVANFIGLAEGTKDWTDPKTLKKVHGQPFYNGTTFHRVIPGFMIQGGDRAGDGTGDPGYFFQDEIDPSLTFDQPGRLAMANAGPVPRRRHQRLASSSSPKLPSRNSTASTPSSASATPTPSCSSPPSPASNATPSDKPLTPVVINRVTIVREGQPMPP